MSHIRIYKDMTVPSLTDVIRVDGEPFDLTAAQEVNFFMVDELTGDPVAGDPATIVDAESGSVRWDWQPENVDTVGRFTAWWRIRLLDGNEAETDPFIVEVVSRATSPRLCSITDIRQQAEWLPTDASVDDKVDDLINMASRQIMKYANREFAPASSEVTRRFRIGRNYRANLHPYDLRSVETAILNPDSDNPIELEASQYELRPFVSQDGVYGWFHLSRLTVLTSPEMMNFGYAYIDITGDWGFPYVPEDVKRACVITVQSWLRRGDPQLMGTEAAQRLGYHQGNMQPSPQGTYDLPYAAQNILKPYRRFVGIV